MKREADRARRAVQDIDYSVSNGDILIQLDTGGFDPTYSFYREFLKVKHGLRVSGYGYVTSATTYAGLVSQYTHILGLTGSPGTPADLTFLEKHFSIQIFDVPRFQSGDMNSCVGFSIVRGLDQWQRKVVDEANKVAREGRPVLIFVETLRDLRSIRTRMGEDTQIMDGTDDSLRMVLDKVSQATQVRENIGKRTISLLVGGRGNDFKISDAIDARGGFHVLLAYFPKSEADEIQIIGRAARYGRSGTHSFVIQNHIEKEVTYTRTDGEKIQALRSRLNRVRTENNEKDVRERSGKLAHNAYIHHLYTEFVRRGGQEDARWAYWFDPISDLSQEFTQPLTPENIRTIKAHMGIQATADMDPNTVARLAIDHYFSLPET